MVKADRPLHNNCKIDKLRSHSTRCSCHCHPGFSYVQAIWPICLIRITRSKLHFVSPSDFICSPCTTGYFKLDVSNKKVIFPFLTLNLRRRRSFAMAARISLSALLKSLQDIKVTKMTIFRRHENIGQCHFDGWEEINNLPPQLKAAIHSDQINRLLGKGNQIRNINDWISIR